MKHYQYVVSCIYFLLVTTKQAIFVDGQMGVQNIFQLILAEKFSFYFVEKLFFYVCRISYFYTKTDEKKL